MYELVMVKNNEVFTTSEVIANGTDTSMHGITKLIEKYAEDIRYFGELSDYLKCSENNINIHTKVYNLNEEQATFVITLLRNNRIVVEFKKNLVDQFYKMRKFILEKQSQEWQETRRISKENRLQETDVIKLLCSYAKAQGSSHYDKLYMTYTKLANTIINCKRNDADIRQLNNLTLVESIILQTIRIDMSIGMHYKEIYKDCKQRIEQFKEIAYLTDKKKISKS